MKLQSKRKKEWVGQKTQSTHQGYTTVYKRVLKDVAVKLDQPPCRRREICGGLRERAKIKQSKQEKWSLVESAESGNCLILAG